MTASVENVTDDAVISIRQGHMDLAHQRDVKRRRIMQVLSTAALLNAGARELYRREVLHALPSASVVFGRKGPQWSTTLHPTPDHVPSGLVEASTHAASVAMASAGGERRSQENPWLSLAAAGLATYHAASAAMELKAELEAGKLDLFSTINAAIGAASLPLVLPEAVRAVRGFFSR